jgi:hypothetical protein
MQPLGYFVSVPAEHPQHKILAEIESRFGSSFQQVPLAELRELLCWATLKSSPAVWFRIFENDTTPEQITDVFNCFNDEQYLIFGRLTSKLASLLIPFLYQVIKHREYNFQGSESDGL